VSGQQQDFWTFSLAVYADPDVQMECLALQDGYGVDVNILLFCAYAGAVHGVVVPEAALLQAVEHVASWQKDVISKLRDARRALKPFISQPSPIADSATPLREQVKASELEAERVEQTMLETWSATRIDLWPRAEPNAAMTANIATLLGQLGAPDRRPAPPHHLMAAAISARH
jgi:uncharacterized protein (TIGR02444 family)